VHIHRYLNSDKPVAIAHRGGSYLGSENTMEAFENAINMGFKFLETDIQITRDKKLIAFHDDTLNRVTDGKGYLRNKTWNELRKIKVAGKYNIPLLSDILYSWPEINLNIDPKNNSSISTLIEFLKKNNVFDRICIGSFSGKRLDNLRKIFGSALCTSAGPLEVLKLKLSSLNLRNFDIDANCVQVPLKYFGIKIIDRNFIDFCHELNLKVHVWTINEIQEMEKLLDLGVDGIMSDNLEGLKTVLTKRNIW